jgi:hypothetical protein
MMFNVETFEMFKGSICKKIVEPSFSEETPLARNPSSNKHVTLHCTKLSSVLLIRCCTTTFISVFINRLYL